MSEHDINVSLSPEEAESLLCVDYDKKDEHRVTAMAKIRALLAESCRSERDQMFGGWTYSGPQEDGTCVISNRQGERIATVCSRDIAASLCNHHDFAHVLHELGRDEFRDAMHQNYNGGHHGDEGKLDAFHHGMDTVCNSVVGTVRSVLHSSGWVAS